MKIIHPQQPVNGLNPEDVFYAVDDLGAQTGYGFILYQMQPGLYPDCPLTCIFPSRETPHPVICSSAPWWPAHASFRM